MTKLREAARQAVNAIEEGKSFDYLDNVIAPALRAALDEQEKTSISIQEMLAFIETQDGDYADEWYETDRDIAACVLSALADYLGIELVVPEYVPKQTEMKFGRKEILEALRPGLNALFGMEYEKSEDAPL